MAKQCTNCGSPIEEGMITCISCGSPVFDEAEEQVFEEMKEEAPVLEEVSAGAEEENTSKGKKFCAKCGKPIDEDAVICIHCGCSADGAKPTSEQDSDNIGWGFLGFFLPIVGFILWLMWKDTMPKKARKLGIGALISVCLGAVGGGFSFFSIFL